MKVGAGPLVPGSQVGHDGLIVSWATAELQHRQRLSTQAKAARPRLRDRANGVGETRLLHRICRAYGCTPSFMLQADAISHGKVSP